ncbi:hypothetical protein ACR79M_05730 [Sphingobacterium spiritivorum]|uniref:hypothetical protein n=1 Tax=Sphingobacterium spiritivorum TaxID=258 RepID=UPI003DA5EF6E
MSPKQYVSVYMTSGYQLFLFVLSICCVSCSFDNAEHKQSSIISKIKYKSGSSEADTLWVSQQDTAVFRREEIMTHRPCSNPELEERFELRTPVNGAYYYIYDDHQQLLMEGKYTSESTVEGSTVKEGNFYNSKTYSYKTNGDLKAIHYREDGRDVKTESFDGNKRLKEILYRDKKSGNIQKVEIYRNGKLKETRVYKSFDTYTTLLADQ